MRFATVRTPSGTRAARVEADRLVELSAPDVRAVLEAGVGAVAESGVEHDLATADLAPVVVHPDAILCLGLNYREHILEMGREMPEHPTIFAKTARALIGARDDVWMPPESHEVDWEAELGLVIGRTVRRADAAEARAAIAGYVVVNDTSMRDWQMRTPQWIAGKTWEHATPIGPWLVTPDEVDDARDLRITCEVDGRVVQDARTSDMLVDPVEVVTYLSTVLTLVPGDVVLTGSPAGAGFGRTPPEYLSVGQTVRTAIEGIGELVNRCVADPTA